jgi:23S rRNA pseudouridine1911/1915/1917 synthase
VSVKNRLHQVTVSPEQAGQRLDKFLATLDFVPSRSRAVELIEAGLVTAEGRKLKASLNLRAGLSLKIELPDPTPATLLPLAAPLDIMFEDEDLVVVNKPSGLVVHPAAGHAQDTLVNILLHHVKTLAMGFGESRPGIVHRLDRDTSGILVIAKNDRAHHHLARQFRMKTAHRIYWALVQGVPPLKAGTFRSHLARHPQDRKRFAVNANGVGKSAVTHYKLKKTLPSKISWMECILETGRTHQIRVHLSTAGLPILGDPIYGPKRSKVSANLPLTRLALHATELGFEHPRTHEKMFFKAGWPDDLLPLVKALDLA